MKAALATDFAPRAALRTASAALRHKTRRLALSVAARALPAATARLLARRYVTPSGQFTEACDAPRGWIFTEVQQAGQTLLRFAPTVPGTNSPRILIVPGLDGRLRQFMRLIRAFQDGGATVDVLVLPGHLDPTPEPCDLGRIVQAIRDLGQSTEVYDGLVAHCVGCNGTLLALDQVRLARRMVFVSAPLVLPNLVRFGGGQYGLRPPCLDHFVRRVSDLGDPLPLNTPWQPIAATQPAPLLVLHARHDGAVPVRDVSGITKAWPGARLCVLDHGDHNSVLSLHAVIDQVTDFLGLARTRDTGKFPAPREIR